jgi:CDP-diacylglycerol--serine O-phosphatidyltransferase
MLPTLLTLANLYCGFGAVYCAAREMQEVGAGREAGVIATLNNPFLEKAAPSYLSIGVWLLVAAMVFDGLDGRVARRTGQASRFGEQLDCLSDMVSFGIAPAMLAIALVHREAPGWTHVPFGFERFGQMAAFFGVMYACCTALRLARFAVEASPAEAAHVGFKGLPSPGAAAALSSVILLQDQLAAGNSFPTASWLLAISIPFSTLALALLMVSRLPYTHFVSLVLKRRPFEHVVALLLLLPVGLLYLEQSIVVAAWVFVMSGPARWVWCKIVGQSPSLEVGAAEETDSSEHQQEHRQQA